MKNRMKTWLVSGVLTALLLQAEGAVHSGEPLFSGAGPEYPVTDFGATGDGVTLNTVYIQKAIDRCAEEGGGRVTIVPGIFLTGTLVMRSNVDLHISEGATLLGSTDIADYPEMTTPYRFLRDDVVKQSLIFGSELENIAITGGGTMDGQGAAFKPPTGETADRYRNRPFLIRFTRCSGVTVKDVTMRNSAMWMQHYLACENMLIENITVYNHCNKNNDMIDIDGCRNVVVTGCTGDSDDDAMTLKSTSPAICENVTISNCVLSSHCNAIKFGTESTGGFKNITVTDCVVKPSAKRDAIYGYPGGISGISLEVVDGGVMDGVTISDIAIDGPEVPLFIRLGNRARPHMEGMEPPGPGTLKNISIRNVSARNCGMTGCSVTGLEGYPACNISIRDFTMQLQGGVTDPLPGWSVPELEEEYPEATMFGILPASVFYLRHLENIDLSEIQVSFSQPDERVHLVTEDVTGLNYSGIHVSNSDTLRVYNKLQENEQPVE